MFRVILAMSESAREIKRDLTSAANLIIEHLLKLYLMTNHESENHWRREIYGFIHNVKKLSTTKKFPSAKMIYEWTYGIYQDVITDQKYVEVMVRSIEEDYTFDFSHLDILKICEDMDRICQNYFLWLSDSLSSVGAISPKQVYHKLDEILDSEV